MRSLNFIPNQYNFASRAIKIIMSIQPTWLNAAYFENILRNFFHDQELTIKNIELSPGANVGDGNLSQVFRVKVITTKKKISIITKVLSTNLFTETINQALNVYDVEKITLQTMLPKMLTKLPNPVKFYPELYHADDAKRTLFLEDLCEDGYQICEHESLGLDLQHSLLIMEALAKLHATSYLVFKENPDLIKNFESSFYCKENWEVVDKMTTINPRRGMAAVMNDLKLPAEYKEKLKNALSQDMSTKMIKSWELNNDCMNVLLHNDCWVNNVMFKYDKGSVKDVKLIDFQIATYNCFAFDLIGFIFSSTSTEVRLNSLENLMDHYYSVFTDIAGNVENFSKDIMWKEFNERLFTGFIDLITHTPWVLAPPKKVVVDLDALLNNKDLDDNIEMFKNPKFLESVEKLLPYFIKHNVI